MTDPFAAIATPKVGFTGSMLDRADALRRDAAALIALRSRPDARWLVFDDLKPVMATSDAGELGGALDLLWVHRSDVPHDALSVFLGLDGGAPRFAAVAPAGDLPGRATDARAVGAQLGDGRAAIVAQARSLLDWHIRHKYCANCGAPTVIEKAGYVRRCDACQTEHFPRTDPVVIMLAIAGANSPQERALVGRGPRFPRGFFSALAGFVEHGESLEEAVARELHEEAGIRIGRVRYIASQPWPFPSSMMIGAFAEALTEDLTLDLEEIAEARWVTKAQVRAALAGTGDWNAPPPLAIAHTLLAEWVRET